MYDNSFELNEKKSPILIEKSKKKPNNLSNNLNNKNYNINESNADYFYESPDMGNSI